MSAHHIVDLLVPDGVYSSTQDDYTRPSVSKRQLAGRIYAFLEALVSKDASAAGLFWQSYMRDLSGRAQVINRPGAVGVLDDLAKAVRSSFLETASEVRRIAWLIANRGISASVLFLKLSMIHRSSTKIDEQESRLESPARWSLAIIY